MQIFLVEFNGIRHSTSSFCFCGLSVWVHLEVTMWAPVRCDPSQDWVVPPVIQSMTGVWMLGGTFDAVMACSRCSCSCLPRGVTGWPYQNQVPLHCGGETRAHCCLRHSRIKIRKNTSKHKGLTYTHLPCLSRRENEQIFFFSFMDQTMADWSDLKYRT